MGNERAATDAAQAVDAINGVFGRQVRNRAIHAKGMVLSGRFTPSPTAAELSRAPHLGKVVSETLVRFSNFSGDPRVSDLDPMASPRGLALRFRLPDGVETDLVTHSFDGFPASTADEFRALFVALAASPPQSGRPTAIESFLRDHPAAKAFLEAPKPPPLGWATLRYFGVNSFRFTNAGGKVRYGRYRLEPLDGERLLTSEELRLTGPDYLREEIRARVARGPIHFVIRVQLAVAGDKIEDPSIPWPANRETVELGTLTLDSVIGCGENIEGPLLFAPAALPDGIEPADPMIRVRDAAYPVSYTRRH